MSGLFKLCSALMDELGQRVLPRSRYEALSERFAEVRTEVLPELTEEDASRIAVKSSSILADYERLNQQQATSTAVEMQHIVGMLNQALMVLAGGSERSVSRLQSIQSALESASHLQDIVALKSSLSETIRFVRNENLREQQAATSEKEHFEKDLAKAREFLVANRSGLLTREEGIRAVSGMLSRVPAGCRVYAIAMAYERMPIVVQRYGPEVAEELVALLIRERLYVLAPGAIAYRWNVSNVVGFITQEQDLAALRKRAAELNQAQLVHRVWLGNRTAVLTMKPSYLVAEAGALELLVEEVDRFSGFRP